MVTIHIREVPYETYEVLRRRARDAGQSMQSYMRDQLIALVSRLSKEEAIDAVGGPVNKSDTLIESAVEDLVIERR